MVERLEPAMARCTLGVCQCLAGTNDLEIDNPTKVAVTWRDKLRIGRLNRIDAWLDLNTQEIKTLEYPLPATTLTYEDFWAIF